MEFTNIFTAFPQYELAQCYMRQMKIEDAIDLFGFYQNEKLYRYLDWNGPETIEKAKECIQFWNKGYEDGWIIRFGIYDKLSNKLIGTIFMNGFDGKRAEIGYELSEKYWRKGIMTEAINKIVEIGFKTLDRTRIQAIVCKENIASEQLLIKCGFQYEGILRNYEMHNITKMTKDMKMYSFIN